MISLDVQACHSFLAKNGWVREQELGYGIPLCDLRISKRGICSKPITEGAGSGIRLKTPAVGVISSLCQARHSVLADKGRKQGSELGHGLLRCDLVGLASITVVSSQRGRGQKPEVGYGILRRGTVGFPSIAFAPRHQGRGTGAGIRLRSPAV